MKTNWWKWGVLIVIAAALFLFGRKCGSDSVKAVVHKDTVRVVVDSGYETVVIDTHYVPKPYKVVERVTDTDTLIWHKGDTVCVLTLPVNGGETFYYSDTVTSNMKRAGDGLWIKDSYKITPDVYWNDTSFYSDTIPIDHGTAVINDTVSQNRITGRSLKVSQRIPVIRETVTLYQPKRNIVYLGVNVQGGPQNYLFAAGADLSLKTKNDRIYSAGVSLTRDNQVLYQGGVRFPIRLKIFDRR